VHLLRPLKHRQNVIRANGAELLDRCQSEAFRPDEERIALRIETKSSRLKLHRHPPGFRRHYVLDDRMMNFSEPFMAVPEGFWFLAGPIGLSCDRIFYRGEEPVSVAFLPSCNATHVAGVEEIMDSWFGDSQPD
jgi:hypothetical protein